MHVMVSIASMFANIFENIDWVQIDWQSTHALTKADPRNQGAFQTCNPQKKF